MSGSAQAQLAIPQMQSAVPLDHMRLAQTPADSTKYVLPSWPRRIQVNSNTGSMQPPQRVHQPQMKFVYHQPDLQAYMQGLCKPPNHLGQIQAVMSSQAQTQVAPALQQVLQTHNSRQPQFTFPTQDQFAKMPLAKRRALLNRPETHERMPHLIQELKRLEENRQLQGLPPIGLFETQSCPDRQAQQLSNAGQLMAPTGVAAEHLQRLQAQAHSQGQALAQMLAQIQPTAHAMGPSPVQNRSSYATVQGAPALLQWVERHSPIRPACAPMGEINAGTTSGMAESVSWQMSPASAHPSNLHGLNSEITSTFMQPDASPSSHRQGTTPSPFASTSGSGHLSESSSNIEPAFAVALS